MFAMRRQVVRYIMLLCLIPTLLILQPGVGARGASSSVFRSARFGYSLTLPAGWQQTQGDCAQYALATTADQNASLKVLVQPGGQSTARVQQLQEGTIAAIGYPQTDFTHATKVINGVRFQVTGNVVQTDAGQYATARVASVVRAGHLYNFVGAVYDTTTQSGKKQVSQLQTLLGSIHFGGQRVGAAPPCATPTPAVAPPIPTSVAPAPSTPIVVSPPVVVGTPQPGSTPLAPSSPQQAVPCNAKNLQAVVSCDENSVVRIDVKLSNAEAQGSGFVLQTDSTGTYVLTNKHVVDGAAVSGVSVISADGGTTYPVSAIVTTSAPLGSAGDLAMLKLGPTSLRPLYWGDSDQLAVGQTVASIGYSLAFQLNGAPSVTEGIVSALKRDLGDGFGSVWIQHQSTLNHGNSGGPLLDLQGNVVGVNTLGIDQLPNAAGDGTTPVQGVFFAIPSNSARQVAQAMLSKLSQAQ